MKTRERSGHANDTKGLPRQNIAPNTRYAVGLPQRWRCNLSKKDNQVAETAKVNARNTCKDSKDSIHKLTKEGVSEDAVNAGEERVQELTDSFVARVDEVCETKQKDILVV